MSKAKLTTEEFIIRARNAHGDRYNYSNVEYINLNTKVDILCSVHGVFSQTPKNHINGANCYYCGIESRKLTNLERYGVAYPSQNEEIYNKIKITNLERYGNACSLRNDEVNIKTKQTLFKNHGVAFPSQSKNVQEKTKNTILERYGVVNVSQNAAIKEKKKLTCLINHGTENPQKNKQISERTKKTNVCIYGCENPFSNELIKEKIKIKMLERYGVKHAKQKNMLHVLPLLEDNEWLYEQYITLNKTTQQIAQELNISNCTIGNYLHKHEIEIRYVVGYSRKCIQWLESIMEREGIFIKHALNGGEFNIPGTKYKADGYCEETNTIYEFHGDIFHGNPDLFEEHEQCHAFNDLTAKELYNKTKERENKIISLGYNLVVIWENDFNYV